MKKLMIFASAFLFVGFGQASDKPSDELTNSEKLHAAGHLVEQVAKDSAATAIIAGQTYVHSGEAANDGKRVEKEAKKTLGKLGLRSKKGKK